MTINDCFLLGTITGTHGTAGAVTTIIDADDPTVYGTIDSLFVFKNTMLLPHHVERIKLSGNHAIVTFSNIKTIEDAQALVGCEVYLPLTKLPKLNQKQFYFHEIAGYRAYDAKAGYFGVVDQVYELPHQNVIAVKHNDQEILVPVNDEFIDYIDRNARHLYFLLPDGLLDVYA